MKSLVIDSHVHVGFFEEMNISDQQHVYNMNMMGLYKTGLESVQGLFNRCDYAGIDKVILLPMDLTTTTGGCVGTNEQVKKLVEEYPERFIGFASVDPNREDALEVLEYAFKDLKLKGLKLHPSKQHFYPDDPKMDEIYRMCIKYNRPITFHGGMSVEPDTLSKYAHPMRFEETAYRFPELRMCIAHFAWPWVQEMCMLMLKYSNVYTDTALLYFDNAPEFYHQVFSVDMGPRWIERTFRHQVMYGSDDPRLEQIRMIDAIREMPLRKSTLDMILGQNALAFIGSEV